MLRNPKGFTLIELMIVVVIIGILAAIAIPNFVAMQDRAKEGSTKANMHTMQLAAEDNSVKNDGVYADDCATFCTVGGAQFGLPANFKNPFDNTTGDNNAWDNLGSTLTTPTTKSGISTYADSSQTNYAIKGYGKSAALALVLTAGQ
jgi:prepilin-type N-terminal cleavage/methylation domain-containing protein